MKLLFRYTTGAAALFLFFGGCGGAEDVESAPAETPTSEPDTPTSPAEETASAETPGYDLHEWGLIDVDMADLHMEVAAGPGHRVDRPPSGTTAAGGSQNPVQPLAGDRPNYGRRKPVLYFHRIESSPPPDRLTVRARVGTGRIVEHWPTVGDPSDVARQEVRWDEVQIGSGPCPGGPFPSADDAVCQAIPDGYCESLELASYVSDDADCVTFGGTTRPFLFYRGDGRGPPLPFTATRTDEGTISWTNQSLAGSVGSALRLRREGGLVRASLVSLPTVGETSTIPLPTENAGDTHREAVRQQLRELGLTPGELAAFERAWFGELFEAEGVTPHAFSDSVLFFLPESAVNTYAQVQADPPPRHFRRAMAFRVGWR